MTVREPPRQTPRFNADTLQALVDHMPVAVMIHQPDTLEVLYANDVALSRFQAQETDQINTQFVRNGDAWLEPPYSWSDIRGWFARAAEQGAQRFVWCTRLPASGVVWEEIFLEPVILDGRLFISSTAVDITARVMAERKIGARMALERLVNRISSLLLTRKPSQTDEAINEVLRLLTEHLGGDRGYVFRFDPGGETLSNTHEWCASGIASQRQDLQRLPAHYQNDWLDALQREQRVVVDQLESQSLTPQLTAIMRAGGIHSILLVPIVQDDEFSGFMGFDAVREARQWPADDIAMVQVVAGLVASALTREALVEALTYQAHHDSLTGLWNRRYLEDHIQQSLQRAERYGSDLSVVIFDVDHFKWVNDRFGHAVGDRVLREVARLLAAATRKSDILARWGGEEFLVLLPETALEGAHRFAESLREQVETYPFTRAEKLTISVGVTELAPADSVDSLLQRADMALYRAKEQGRNRVAAAPIGPD